MAHVSPADTLGPNMTFNRTPGYASSFLVHGGAGRRLT